MTYKQGLYKHSNSFYVYCIIYTFLSFWWLHSDGDGLTKCTKVVVSIHPSTLHM